MKIDKTTVLGLIFLVVLIIYGYVKGEIPKVIFNLHAFFVVIGGTLIATIISTPYKYIKKTFKYSFLFLKEGSETEPEKVIAYIVEVADKVRKEGFRALREVDLNIADGFIKRVSDAIVEYSDMQFVKNIIKK